MMTMRLMTVATLVLALAAAGCTTYYRVTEPGESKVYYTDDFKRSGGTPASEVTEISKDEYKKGIEKK
jgi:outer membrane protein assembly factor BamE (lipoprotein component of BamABCDE complex)